MAGLWGGRPLWRPRFVPGSQPPTDDAGIEQRPQPLLLRHGVDRRDKEDAREYIYFNRPNMVDDF